MANPEHLAKLKEGVETWNKWRREKPDVSPGLKEANLSGAKKRTRAMIRTAGCYG